LERAELPDAAVLASLGCGNPTAVADLHPGERVLDLGSGGGIDVLLSAKRIGPTGRAIGLDMTDEMLALPQRNAAEAGATDAALTAISITPTHEVVPGMVSAIVKATKPASAAPTVDLAARELPLAASGSCGGEGCC